MSDLSFVDRIGTEPKRDWREHHRDIVREALRFRIERIQDDCDDAVDRARQLMKAGGDITDELAALEGYAASFGIVIALLKSEAAKAKEAASV